MPHITIPYTEYNEWRTNELVFTPTPWSPTLTQRVHFFYIPNDGRIQLIIRITQGAAARSFISVHARGQVDGLDVQGGNTENVPFTNSAGIDRDIFYCIGPFDPAFYNDDDGNIALRYDFINGNSSAYDHYSVAVVRS